MASPLPEQEYQLLLAGWVCSLVGSVCGSALLLVERACWLPLAGWVCWCALRLAESACWSQSVCGWLYELAIGSLYEWANGWLCGLANGWLCGLVFVLVFVSALQWEYKAAGLSVLNRLHRR